MSGESPDVILYDNNSNALAVQNGVAIPASTPALMIAGSDGTNSRYITIDTSGRSIVAGAGVAGTPAGGVITIQGVSGGTTVPVSGTVTANQGGAPWSENITQFGGTNISTGTGAGGSGIPRVTVSNDSNVLSTQSGTWTVQPGNTANTTPWLATVNQGGNSAAVKAASTTAVVTDTSLVVAVNPNTSVNGGTISAANSSTVTLGSAATFTGTSESTLGYQAVTVMVMAIGASAPPGTLIVEQSSDGTNWDVQNSYTVAGGTASPTGEFDVIIPMVASNFRIVYTNGATAQTAFRLQSIKWPIKVGHPDPVQKGIQPATFVATQNAKDSGRVVKIFEVSAVAGVTTEAMVTLTPLSNFTAGSTGTTFTVTAGKTLRLQALVATVRATTTTAVGAIVRLRISASGSVTTATPVSSSVGVYESVAVANHSSSNWVPLPDGLELSGTMQLGISQLATATSASLDIQVIGYEY